jgi:hypothetical protein
MKTLKITLTIILFSTISLMAQEKAPKWIVDKSSGMKEQAKIDLQLTQEEADKYHQIILDKYLADGAKIKTLATDEEKKAYYTESFKKLIVNLKASFGKEKGIALQKWTAENHAKFNKPKN